MPELTAQDVANMTGRPRNSISRAVHRMLTEGYLDRTPDPDDGRQAMLRITPKGRKFHERIVKRFIARGKELLSVQVGSRFPLLATSRERQDKLAKDRR